VCTDCWCTENRIGVSALAGIHLCRISALLLWGPETLETLIVQGVVWSPKTKCKRFQSVFFFVCTSRDRLPASPFGT
jgi:hypothetical protein